MLRVPVPILRGQAGRRSRGHIRGVRARRVGGMASVGRETTPWVV